VTSPRALRDLVNAAALISLVGAAPRLKAPGRGDASTVHDVRRGKRGDQTEVFIKTGTGLIDWVLASVDRLFGGNGHDRLFGQRGRDRLFGARGRDLLFGQVGHDRLFGGKGPDKLKAGAGRDRCVGGPARDIYKSCERIRG
jgi:Ca2+-binding RTX toxin-like protein